MTRREREIRALFDHEPRLARSCAKPPGGAKPASGARACSARSAIETHPLGIDKDRIAHFNFDVAAANNERRKSSASIEQLRWPSGVNRFTIAESKAFLYIYAPFAIELALRFRPFKIKNATGPFSRTRKIRIGPRE